MSNVNVFYRIKNMLDEKKDILTVRNNSIIVENNRPRVIEKKHYKIYRDLNIFDKHATNSYIYECYYKHKLQQFLKNDIPTFSIMAYGQTGSGKTHTLFGNKQNKGLIYNILAFLLKNKVDPKISCLEIYNNKITDIFYHKQEIKIYDGINHIVLSRDLCKLPIHDYDFACKKIEQLLNLRVTGCTKLNHQSSRSHLVVTLSFNNKKIYIIDLAGNEKGKYSVACNDKSKLNEYININKSLFALKECIRGLSNNNPYVPYRNSKLTFLLKDIFFNNGFITFIATIFPAAAHFYDIIDTIKFSKSLQKNSIVLSIHKTLEHTVFLKEYLNYIYDLCKLISKDYEKYTIFKSSDVNPADHVDDLSKLFNEKIIYIQKIQTTLKKYEK